MKPAKNAFLGFAVLGVLFVGLTWMQSSQFAPSSDAETWPTRRALRNKLFQMRQWLWVYGTGDPNAATEYRRFAESQADLTFRNIEIVVKADTAVSETELRSRPVTLVGTPESNRWLRAVLPGLPLTYRDGRLALDRLLTLENRDVLSISLYPNPLAPSLPLSLITANRDDAVLDFVSRVRRWWYVRLGEFVVERQGQRLVLGFFKQNKTRPWSIDYERTRKYFEFSRKVARTEHYEFWFHGNAPDQPVLRELAEQQEQRLQSLLSRLSRAGANVPSLPTIHYHLYESLEDKGLITGRTSLSHSVPDKNEVHAVFHAGLRGTDFYADAQLVLERLLGATRNRALKEGLAIYFSHGWGRRGFRSWAKTFHRTGDLISLKELLDPDVYQKESYLFARPQAGSFVEFLAARYGWNAVLRWYRSWPANGLPTELRKVGLAELERGWHAHLAELQLSSPPVSRPAKRGLPGFQKGFCYAHEGYQIYNGYLSRESFRSLKRLRELGTEWISLTPFGYLRRPDQPDYFRFSFGPGSENDESLIVAAQYARELGMRVMLKPHVLMWRAHWGWPGDIKMTNSRDWQRFFDYYYRWIRHYALLAEMYEMDIFCVGVELSQTTKGHGAAWRELIERVRRIYHGPLVYAANWWQEFEHVTFWDALDYIGLNCYFPLSDKDRATVDELRAGFKSFLPTVESVARQYDRPVLLTEIGFTSGVHPWKQPHERRRRAPVDLQAQAWSYQAAFEALWGQDWLQGIYWWKWPTYLEYGGPDHNGFTPNGKPAEDVVREWYGKKSWRPRTSD